MSSFFLDKLTIQHIHFFYYNDHYQVMEISINFSNKTQKDKAGEKKHKRILVMHQLT